MVKLSTAHNTAFDGNKKYFIARMKLFSIYQCKLSWSGQHSYTKLAVKLCKNTQKYVLEQRRYKNHSILSKRKNRFEFVSLFHSLFSTSEKKARQIQ